MEILEQLQQKNPALRLYSVNDPEFSRYGRVLELPGCDLLSYALSRTPIPESGNCYVASDPALEAQPAVRTLRRLVYGEAEIQAGYCNGRGDTLNAEEYHRCSEVNLTTTGLVLLLALPEDLRDRRLHSKDVVGFYLPPMTAVEVLPLVLHFAPCKIAEAGFNCLVILEKDTNTPISGVDTGADGEQKLLWMRNKWLTCHPASPQAGEGAYVGITGENIVLSL